MKTVALAVFALSSVLLGVLLAQEKSQAHRQAARVAELETRVTRQSAEIQTQTQAVAGLQEEKTKLAAKVESTKQKLVAAREAAKAAAAAPAPADAAAPTENPAADATKSGKDAKKGNPLKGYMAGVAKMMKDPAMKQMLRSSQSTAVRQMYGDLVKQWGMSPEQSGKFYDLVLDKQMESVDRSVAAEENNQNPTERASAAAASLADADAQIKAALGENYFQQYKDYEKTVPDRMLLSQYQQRLSADNAPALTSEQSQFLARTMGEARQTQGVDASANPFVSKDGSFNLDKTAVDSYMQKQTAMNEQVAQRAAGVLSAQQLDSFKAYQKQMLDMQRMGMEMAAKMNEGGGKP